MTQENKKINMAAFMKALEEKCEELSKRQLIDVLLEMAADTPVPERADFLDRFNSAASDDDGEPEEDEEEEPEVSELEAILGQIEALKEEIDERIEAIENGEFYDDDDGYDQYDEDPEWIDEEQTEELDNLFLVAEEYFLSENLEDAKQVYKALFELSDGIEDYHLSSSIDLKEARASYVRAVYETTPPEDRIEAVAECMVLGKGLNPYARTSDLARYPMIRDVVETLPDDLKDKDQFLAQWIGYLSDKPDERSALLRLEALRLLKGMDGVAEAVREYGASQPRGYLFWIETLKAEEDWTAMARACKEAIETLPANQFRETAAQYLVEACEKTEDDPGILAARREKFIASATQTNMLDFLTEATRQDVRDAELADLLATQAQGGVFERDQILHTKALLMAGSVQEALKIRKTLEPVEWSGSPAGLLFSSLLRILTDHAKEAVAVGEMFRMYAGSLKKYSYHSEDDAGKYNEIAIAEVEKGIGKVKPSAEEAADWLDWAEHIGCARIDQIVSGKNRGEYGNAALTLGALCEYYVLASDMTMARNLMNGFVGEKYPRHTAFKNEVKLVVSRSLPLKQIGFSANK